MKSNSGGDVSAGGGEQCAMNGKCAPPPPVPPPAPVQREAGANIDDIATPSDLQFDQEFDFEHPDIIEKRIEIEKCLENMEAVELEHWQRLARARGGLVADKYRRKIWPLLVGVTRDELTEPPALAELAGHSEYSQVVLDVGRSLKRFPPGVPLARRLALQDQLTVLILRVILLHPHLKYYQGYHDVAITLLLVVGARAACPLLVRLSAGPRAPLAPFLQPTMQPTQHLLNHMLPLLARARPRLAARLHAAEVGTMFALPWFLTWFGHSLPRYATVVRLYDYFLCAPPLMPVYVTAAIVMHREEEVFECECDMAMMHCLLSRLPDALPFEELLESASALYSAHPPASLAAAVRQLEADEEEQRRADDERRRRAVARRGAGGRAGVGAGAGGGWARGWARRGYVLAAAAALLGVYVYYRPELLLPS